jgi:hypothetical protein
MNMRLKSPVSIVRDILSVLDADGIKAQVVLIADTTSFEGKLNWEITCEEMAFKNLVSESLTQYVPEF